MANRVGTDGSLDQYVEQARQDARFFSHILKDNVAEARLRRPGTIEVREVNGQVCLLLPYANGDRIFDRLRTQVDCTDTYGKRTGLVDALAEMFSYKPSLGVREHIRLAPNPVWVSPANGRKFATVRPYPANEDKDVPIDNGVLPDAVNLNTLPLRVVEADEGKPRLALVFNKQESSEQAMAMGSLLADELEKALGMNVVHQGAGAVR